ncbi:hypothetical protein SAMN05518672_104754 [Chitinophaga sp. CF118]|uniref:hypothetical protein n=1 Tax=Chitinophaga sp. CF118 TaxID=1884367 RepID=UPI0008E5E673|nr:hypothetical protein [Chitinophaga sp. CF118]SFE17251.1 hypothetical protein SAMN05518672_104754 [Chitinophaga sp. CF118]
MSFKFTKLLFLFSLSVLSLTAYSQKKQPVKTDQKKKVASAKQKEKAVMPPKKPSVFKEPVKNFMSHDVTVASFYLKKEQKVIFFEDTINGMECTTYLMSEVEVINKVGTPKRTPGFKRWTQDKPAISVNNSLFMSSLSIRNAGSLIPVSIAYFKFYDDEYIMINMQLFSVVAGEFWSNILLKLDKKHKVIKEYVIESNEKMNRRKLGDYNNDHDLDYSIYNKEISADGKSMKRSMDIYSVDGDKKIL